MHTPDAFEASFIFFPQPQLRGDPSHVGLQYEDVWLTTDDGNNTHAWFIKGEDNDASRHSDAAHHYDNPCRSDNSSRSDTLRHSREGGNQKRILMLITHGNGGNISVRLDQYREFVTRFRHIDIFALEYRGYGLSDGSPSEEGFALDALAARRWIDERIRHAYQVKPALVYFGRSLGGAVATRLAATHPPDALILECPISSIPDLAKTMTPWRYLPVEKFIHNRFDAVSNARDVRCPLLVMHSEFDEIVPIESGRKLFDAATGQKRFYVIKGAPHNGADYYDPEGYYAAMGEFLGDYGMLGGAKTSRMSDRNPMRTS